MNSEVKIIPSTDSDVAMIIFPEDVSSRQEGDLANLTNPIGFVAFPTILRLKIADAENLTQLARYLVRDGILEVKADGSPAE